MNSKRIFSVVASLATLTILSACGDSGNGSDATENTEGELIEAATLDDLPNCTENREGVKATVGEKGEPYICQDGSWEKGAITYETEDDMPNCTEKREGERAYVEDEETTYICEDEEWVELKRSSSSKKKKSSSSTSDDDDDDDDGDDEGNSSSSKKTSSSASSQISDTMTDDRDGQVYKITKIGDQVWMAQNLNYDGGDWYCPSGKKTEDKSCEKYGKLYRKLYSSYYDGSSESTDGGSTLDALCPVGWLIPEKSDWKKLIDYVDDNNGSEGVGKSLKATKGWYEVGYEQVDEYSMTTRVAVAAGKDKFGFSALPAGSCWDNGGDANCYTDDETRFWVAPSTGMKLSFDNDDIVEDEDVIAGYVSMRCIMDVDLGTCDKNNQGKIKKNRYEYICKNGKWRRTTDNEDIRSSSSGSSGDSGDDEVIFTGSLWDIWDNPGGSYQVQTPAVLDCWENADYGDYSCYSEAGGWWFPYSDNGSPGVTASISPIDKTTNADGSWRLIYMDDYGNILPDGNLVEDKGLWATMSVTTTKDAGVVGLGFNWTKDGDSEVDISAYGGFCLSYSSDGDPVQITLAWDGEKNGYDNWYYELPEGEHSIRIPWSKFTQIGYDTRHITTIETATKNTHGLHFRIYNTTGKTMTNTFVIKSLGWLSDCE